MREKAVEAHLRKQVQAMGGMCLKLMPMPAGIPDRIVVFPDNRVYFVETKQPKGEVSAVQLERHRRLTELGYPVAVLWNKREVDQWLEDL